MTSIPTSTAITALLLAALGCASGGVMALNQEMLKALAVPEVKERLASLGADIVASSPEQTAAFFKSELVKYTKVAQAAKIRAE
jgi:tripartite-type tricarboxylate transporter receptor subunit TctC